MEYLISETRGYLFHHLRHVHAPRASHALHHLSHTTYSSIVTDTDIIVYIISSTPVGIGVRGAGV